MLKTKNFGRKSLNEIKEILTTMGLSLGHAARPGRRGAGTGLVDKDRSHASQNQSSETRPGHGASHLDAPQPGHRAAPLRADRDDRAEGEGAAAVRRADHQPSPSAASPPARPTARRCTPAASSCATCRTATSSASCSTRSRRASRRGRAATRASCASATAAATAPRRPRSSWSAASTIPNAATGRSERRHRPKKTGVGGRLRAAAERLRGKKAEPAEEGAEGAENKAKPKRQLKSDKGGRATTKGKASAPRAPRKAGGA